MKYIYKFFASLKVAIALMVLLCGVSILGTFIPQKAEAQAYMASFPNTWQLIIKLGLNDVYASYIFIGLMLLLSVSTLVCILTRWKATSYRYFNRLKRAGVREISALRYRREFEIEWPVKPLVEQKELGDGGVMSLNTSGKLALLGGMLIHIGFLAILAGGIIGTYYSVETVINGAKGDIVAIAPVSAIRAARDSDRIARSARTIQAIYANHPSLEERLDAKREKMHPLHEKYHEGLNNPAFRVAFDDLWVEHHKDSEGRQIAVRAWNSKIRFIEDDKESEPVVVRVNSPVTYGGYTFYQANWNNFYRTVTLRVDLREGTIAGWEDFETDVESPKYIDLTINQPFKPDWSPFTFVLNNFYPDFRTIEGQPVTVSNNLNNPAAWVIAKDDEGNDVGRAVAFTPDKVFDQSHVTGLPFLLTFHDAKPEYETGLQMTHDPGKPIVWFGCFVFTLGLIMSFYIPYKEEWLVLQGNKVVIAVSGNRPKDVMESWLDALEKKIIKEV